jgi:TRAP-type C4-dicarboxylate transport system permease small subunit
MQSANQAAAGLARRLGELHDRVTVAGFAVAAALVGAIAAAFCYEVVARYFFSAPTAWTYDVGCYLLAAVIFLAMPEMTRRGAHIHVGLIFDHLTARGARALRLMIGALAVAACLSAAWFTGSETWRQFEQGVWTLSALPIPKWWVSIMIPYGMLSSALYFLRQLGRAPAQTSEADS